LIGGEDWNCSFNAEILSRIAAILVGRKVWNNSIIAEILLRKGLQEMAAILVREELLEGSPCGSQFHTPHYAAKKSV